MSVYFVFRWRSRGPPGCCSPTWNLISLLRTFSSSHLIWLPGTGADQHHQGADDGESNHSPHGVVLTVSFDGVIIYEIKPNIYSRLSYLHN